MSLIRDESDVISKSCYSNNFTHLCLHTDISAELMPIYWINLSIQFGRYHQNVTDQWWSNITQLRHTTVTAPWSFTHLCPRTDISAKLIPNLSILEHFVAICQWLYSTIHCSVRCIPGEATARYTVARCTVNPRWSYGTIHCSSQCWLTWLSSPHYRNGLPTQEYR